MGNEQSIRDLIKNRDTKYGRSWYVTGLILKLLNTDNIIQHGLFFAWVMILNKSIRALTTPDNPDHWRDIAGYAMLILDQLEAHDGTGK